MPVARLRGVSITVANLSTTADFFRYALRLKVGPEQSLEDPALHVLLGLEPGTKGRTVDVVAGGQTIELVAFDPPGRPYPSDGAANDQWFQHIALVTADIVAASEPLRRGSAGLITKGAPVVLPPNTGGVSAFKFRDPEGHPLELIVFPSGVGAPVWQSAEGTGILGYDHTAIAVSHLERSVAFYADLLGFRVAGRSLNRGPEQDQLDGLAGCEVDVLALEPAAMATPHVELLHYRSPRGRVTTAGMRANDVASVRQIHEAENLDVLVDRLRTEDVRFVSSEIVTLGDGRRAASVNDPDGHMLVLIE